MDKLLQEIGRVYTELQNMNIQPTKGNVTILQHAFKVLEQAHAYIRSHPEEEKEVKEDV